MNLKKINKYLVDSLSYMALGLFASLIISLIIRQISLLPLMGFLAQTYEVGTASINILTIISSATVVGAAIGVAIGYGLKSDPLAIFSLAAAGAIGYSFGGPLGAYIAAIGGEIVARYVSKKTIIDIVITPFTIITVSSIISIITGPTISAIMTYIGNFIEYATTVQPFVMGILIATSMGMILTAPISSAAISIMLGLRGISAGAAMVGCATQMVGFAVQSYRDNKWNGVLSVGLGTSMLQFANIVKKPIVWLPTIIVSAIMGPLSTMLFKMENIPTGAGMGTSGLVGLFGAYEAMGSTGIGLIFLIILVNVVIPAILVLAIDSLFRKYNLIKIGDLKINVGEKTK
jgi:uncharacterized membrane protein